VWLGAGQRRGRVDEQPTEARAGCAEVLGADQATRVHVRTVGAELVPCPAARHLVDGEGCVVTAESVERGLVHSARVGEDYKRVAGGGECEECAARCEADKRTLKIRQPSVPRGRSKLFSSEYILEARVRLQQNERLRARGRLEDVQVWVVTDMIWPSGSGMMYASSLVCL
jgi:hypothetical protein